MLKTCPGCGHEQAADRTQCEACGADLPAAARPVPRPPPPEEPGPTARCLRCGRTELQPGGIPDRGGGPGYRLRFKPAGNWVTTYEVKAVACLGCGFVHLMLGLDDCRAIRGK